MKVSVELQESDELILKERIRIGDGAFTRQQLLDAALGQGIDFISNAAIQANENADAAT